MTPFDVLRVGASSDQPLSGQSLAIWLAVAIAFAAMAVGPYMSLRIARKQQRAAVTAAHRLAWMSELRDHIAELLAIEGWYRWLPAESGGTS